MKKTISIITAVILAAVLLAGCAGQPAVSEPASPSASASVSASAAPSEESSPSPAQKTDVSVASLIGPTGMGLVQLMDKQDKGEAACN